MTCLMLSMVSGLCQCYLHRHQYKGTRPLNFEKMHHTLYSRLATLAT